MRLDETELTRRVQDSSFSSLDVEVEISVEGVDAQGVQSLSENIAKAVHSEIESFDE